MENMKSVRKRNDLVLAVVLLLVAAVGGGAFYFTHREPAVLAEVTVDGRLVETLDLGSCLLQVSRDEEGVCPVPVSQRGRRYRPAFLSAAAFGGILAHCSGGSWVIQLDVFHPLVPQVSPLLGGFLNRLSI